MAYHFRVTHSPRDTIIPLWCGICKSAWRTLTTHALHMKMHERVKDYEVPHSARLWDRRCVPPPKRPRASEDWRALHVMKEWNPSERRVTQLMDVQSLDDFLNGEPLVTSEGPQRVCSSLQQPYRYTGFNTAPDYA